MRLRPNPIGQFAVACLLFSNAGTQAQPSSPTVPLLQSGDKIFAIGVPRIVGSLPIAYAIRWRRDGSAVAFLGRLQTATLKQERASLLQGEKIDPEAEPSLLIYDAESGQLQLAGKLKIERDKEYFREMRWVGKDLYVSTATIATPQSPQVTYRLYFYSPKIDKATLIDEAPSAPQLEESPTDAPFLVERRIIGEEQRFRVVAEGKIFEVSLPEDKYLGAAGWSRDGKRYFREKKPQENEEPPAFAIHYEAGAVKVETVAFDRQRDLIVLQPEPPPTLTIKYQESTPGLRQHLLSGTNSVSTMDAKNSPQATAASDESVALIPNQYTFAFSQSKDSWLAPNNSALLYITQQTLFFQAIVELQGKNRTQILARLEESEVQRIAEVINKARQEYETLQERENSGLAKLTVQNCRQQLTSYISDTEALRRFQWSGKGSQIGEVRGKRLRAVVNFDGTISTTAL